MKVVALSGGVGGARLLHGLAHALPPESLTAIVNTGDDFVHWGLHVSPDLDTVMYALADLAHEERGWGLREESFGALEMVRRYGGDDWFALGDRDLGTHILRTEALGRGQPLSAITTRLFSALGIEHPVLPMADGACRTMIETLAHGTLTFQNWFVRHRAPRVRRVFFEGSPPAAPGVVEALRACDLVVLGPSNPYVSIDPILQIPGVREAVFARPCVALSPIVRGAAIKGPLAQMIADLRGEEASPGAIVRHYEGRLAGIVVERGDEGTVSGTAVLGAETVMKSRGESLSLARTLLDFARTLR